MALFQESYWGFELTFVEPWHYRGQEGAIWFVPRRKIPEEDNEQFSNGHLIIRAAWTYPSDSVEKYWIKHVITTAGSLGAKNIGSAPLVVRKAKGFEAEIILPKKENTRLWLGILKNGPVVLNMVVAHHIKDREWFEPAVSKMIASLNFFQMAETVPFNNKGLPLPPGYDQTNPLLIMPDIQDIAHWEAYSGTASIGALQAFYMRELENYGWSIRGYIPFPSIQTDLGFARFEIEKEAKVCTLGIMPYGSEPVTSSSPAQVVIKWR